MDIDIFAITNCASINNFEFMLLFLRIICFYFPMNCLLLSFIHLPIGLLIFLLFIGPLYMLWNLPFLWLRCSFFSSLSFGFLLPMIIFLIFIKSNVSICKAFSVRLLNFVLQLRKSVLHFRVIKGSKGFFQYFCGFLFLFKSLIHFTFF